MLIAALFFVVAAPTLSWLEFSNGSENLNVATALEIRRTGNWLLPTLQGEPRYAKPPLTVWITAASIRQSTFDALSNPDPILRANAYRDVAWQMRWPAYATSCLSILALYLLARALCGNQIAVSAALIFGTSFAFIRFSRSATTDVYLTFWVIIANVFLAKALLQNQRWTGFIGAGVAIGLAFMSKGPVALVQTLAPAIAFAAYRYYVNRRAGRSSFIAHRSSLRPIASAIFVGLLIALPWFIHVVSRIDAWDRWRREVISGDQTVPGDSILAYSSLFPILAPWTAFFIVGLLLAITHLRSTAKPETRNPEPVIFALFLVFVPIVVMTCVHRDRNERYLLPMIGPASILAAYGLLSCFAPRAAIPAKIGNLLAAAQFAILIGAGVFLPLLGATGLLKATTRDDGTPWFSWSLAISVALACLLILLVGVHVYRRRPMSLIATSVLIMLIAQTIGAHGYRYTDLASTRPLADLIWSRFPQADMYSYRPGQTGRRAPEELSIYLNRSVRPIQDPAVIELANRPQVVMVYQRAGRPMPDLPANWKAFATLPRKEDAWHGFVVPPND
jgi:4-amino-4-deoxy-L-arabinose transferase-like glycosyltransferase